MSSLSNPNLSASIYHGGFTASCPIVGMTPVTPAGTGASFTALATTLRGFKVLNDNAGANVAAVMLDGSIGYWENLTSEFEYDGMIQQIVTSATFNGLTVTTTATYVVGLL